MFLIYRVLTTVSTPLLISLLNKRLRRGKEHPDRFQEKKAVINIDRPAGKLVWLHAASVGEAQSALIVINNILQIYPDHTILVTTGTVTSAEMMAKKLPPNAIHQFAPLDHPSWVKNFFDHWRPDFVIWMESELWPNMLNEIKERNIRAALLNAHISDKSYETWKKIPFLPKRLLSTFDMILCQTEQDKDRFEHLGGEQISITDNLKYSANPLPYDQNNLIAFQGALASRKLWLYASTHKGEEDLACHAHTELKKKYPDLLTIIIPRHPERRDEIKQICAAYPELKTSFRSENKERPNPSDDIYVADTLGELGLFYKLSPIACIGRSFSDDGGGGHNPIEAAQMDCAVLHGPNVQNLQDIFDDMNAQNACMELQEKEQLVPALDELLSNKEKCHNLQKAAKQFSLNKTSVINTVMAKLKPALDTV